MRKKIGMLMMALSIWIMGTMLVVAAEAETNMLVQVLEDISLYEDPNEESEVIGTLSAGDPAICVEKAVDGWIKISYQELAGYTRVENVKLPNDEELNQEFEQIANQNALLINELEYTELQKKQKTTWGIIIGVLVVAIFAVGIASAMMKNIHDREQKTGHIRKKADK
ncbi:MAG: SH3 domain-containing protein [Lachnospiraceae bacterium]|nr:SH3 domain-containing protein [Lachnospiraceae bacterium]